MATGLLRPVAFDLLRRSEHVLLVVLLALGVGGAWSSPLRWVLIGGAAAVGGWYGWGIVVARKRRTRATAVLWLAILTVGCAGLAVGSAGFVWLAFPLFLLYTQLLPLRIAVPSVVLVVIGVIVRTVIGRGGWDTSVVVGPVIGATVAVVISVVYRDLAEQTRQRARLIDQLTSTRDELAASERQAGMLAERERLARELHDTVTQELTGIILLLRTARDTKTGSSTALHDQLDIAIDSAGSVLTETRRMVQALTPTQWSESSLPEALNRVLAASTGPDTRLHLDGEQRSVPTPVAVALLRAAQEGVANAVRHARADRIDVTLTFLPDAVSLDVVDDGIGFDPEQPYGSTTGTGLGLSGLRTRIAELDGTMEIESVPGQGTALNLTVPRKDRDG
ncbi:sensor histidine kinase [Microlunatus soli]|uniref:Oxygen sensor histidine kinase NreB n=1 Tax=Microlunatus soli TaxID=630515 RepID=A0A1H1X874_9ACTN|nr:sensor histidine kinase [Microlunatus soli]SDT05422.1 Signal transduction histidine kinase [Microlunatus soli]